jgi:hypothetical protein
MAMESFAMNRYVNEQIVVTLLRQLSWSHVLSLIPRNEHLHRGFYAGRHLGHNLRNGVSEMALEPGQQGLFDGEE